LTRYVKEIDCELTAVQIHELDLIIVTVYRSPKDNFEKFLESIDNVFCDIKLKNVVFCGDFNIDFSFETSTDNERKKRRFLDLTPIYNMHASIKEPTRVGKTSSTIRDNFLTTISETIKLV